MRRNNSQGIQAVTGSGYNSLTELKQTARDGETELALYISVYYWNIELSFLYQLLTVGALTSIQRETATP